MSSFFYYLDLEEPELIQESEKKSAEGDISVGIIEEDSIEITEVVEHSNEADGEEHSSQVEEEEIEEHSGEEGNENKNENENEIENENEKLTEENEAANDEIFDEKLEDLNEIEFPVRIVKMKIPVTIDDDKKVRKLSNQFYQFIEFYRFNQFNNFIDLNIGIMYVYFFN